MAKEKQLTADELLHAYDYWASDAQRRDFTQNCEGMPVQTVQKMLNILNKTSQFLDYPVTTWDQCVEHFRLWDEYEATAAPAREALEHDIAIANGDEPAGTDVLLPTPPKPNAEQLQLASHAWHDAIKKRDNALAGFKIFEAEQRGAFEVWLEEQRKLQISKWTDYVARKKKEYDNLRGLSR